MQRTWPRKTSPRMTPAAAQLVVLVLCVLTILLSFISLVVLVTTAAVLKTRWDIFLGAMHGLVFMEAVLACHPPLKSRKKGFHQNTQQRYLNLSDSNTDPPRQQAGTQRRSPSLLSRDSAMASHAQWYLLLFTFSIWLMTCILYSVGYAATVRRRHLRRGSSWSLEESHIRLEHIGQGHFTKLLILGVMNWIVMLALAGRMIVLRKAKHQQRFQQWS